VPQVGTFQVRLTQINAAQMTSVQIRLSQIGPNARITLPPLIPGLNALPQYPQMFTDMFRALGHLVDEETFRQQATAQFAR
jgi:hypothetical protein